MVAINMYMDALLTRLRQAFGPSLLYVGLQGSYLRGEATEDSDIDVMVVLETVDLPALDRYRAVLEVVGDTDKACGFLCSRADLAHWNPTEIPHLLRCTKDYHGVLAELVPPCTEYDLKVFLQTALGNLYHEITHRYIHRSAERSLEALSGLHRPVFFILQNLLLYRDGIYPETRGALAEILTGTDLAVWEMLCRCRKDGHGTTEDLARLLTWCETTLQTL